jgi:hypothetical protein
VKPAVARPAPVVRPAGAQGARLFRLTKLPARFAAGLAVALFLVFVFAVVYEFRILGNANALSRRIDSGQIGLEDGAKAYRALAAKSWFAMPLFPARNSLRDRYVAEADRVLADYREASESTPVYAQDWQRAAASINAALGFALDDKGLQGRNKLIQGFVNLLRRDPRTRRPNPDLRRAREDFEDARTLLPHSPDPHLGLAQIYMHDGDLDQAERELDESQKNGFRPGRREQRDLADAYRRRGERLMALAQKAHSIDQMEDSLQRADKDLEHAQNRYREVAPFFDGVAMAERMAAEREQAATLVAKAKMAQPPESPRETP